MTLSGVHEDENKPKNSRTQHTLSLRCLDERTDLNINSGRPIGLNLSVMNITKAWNHLRNIQNYHQAEPQVYRRYLKLLQLYREGKLSYKELSLEVAELFQTSASLIKEFEDIIQVENDSKQQIAQGARQLISLGYRKTEQLNAYNKCGEDGAENRTERNCTNKTGENVIDNRSFNSRRKVGEKEMKSFILRVRTELKDNEKYHTFCEMIYSMRQGALNLLDIDRESRSILGEESSILKEFQLLFFGFEAQPIKSDLLSESNLFKNAVGVMDDRQKPSSHNFDNCVNSTENTNDNWRSDKNERNTEKETDLNFESAFQVPLSMEVFLFERVKRSINDDKVYTEFLRLMNIFSQDLITAENLLVQIKIYLARDPDLYEWFQDVIERGYQGNRSLILDDGPSSNRLEDCGGPSYKKLKLSGSNIACSGRDSLCREVLNDIWVAHPVWASEDAGFIAHRKNHHEEILFRVEEERHEYDHYIECNTKTIESLESVLHKIESMPENQRRKTKLPFDLGTDRMPIYRKALKRIYGFHRGAEISDSILNNPAINIPPVLEKLKKINSKWIAAKQQWRETWRHAEKKAYYKSLDHLGLSFRNADKKFLNMKQFELEVKGTEIDNLSSSCRVHDSPAQIRFEIDDQQVLNDILYLFKTCVLHQIRFSIAEKKKMIIFLITVLREIFMLKDFDIVDDKFKSKPTSYAILKQVADYEATKEEYIFDHLFIENEAAKEHLVALTATENMTRMMNEQNSGNQSYNIWLKRRRLLDSRSKDGSIQSTNNYQEGLRRKEKTYILNNREFVQPSQCASVIPKQTSIIANSSLFYFFRLLAILYTRLATLKTLKPTFIDTDENEYLQFLSAPENHQAIPPSNETAEISGYKHFVNYSAMLLESSIDSNRFEDSLRLAYDNKAYQVYNIDKVIQLFVQGLRNLMLNGDSVGLLSLYGQGLEQVRTDEQDMLYFTKASKLIPPGEDMYQISVADNCILLMDYLGTT